MTRSDERQRNATLGTGADNAARARSAAHTEITLAVPPDIESAHGGGAPRLDRFLAGCFPAISRTECARLIASGAVRIDGRAARKGDTLAGGETITLPRPHERGEWTIITEPDAPLVLIHEDDALLAIEKPPGVPCHPLRPDERGTIANALVARFPSQAAIGLPLEGGLVHRLDTGTSGVLVAARTAEAYARLRAVWSEGSVEKVYLAIVEGRVAQAGVIDAALAQHARSARRMVLASRTTARGTLAAHTAFEPLRAPSGSTASSVRTLLRIVIREGRRHQIRVHLASIGHPVAGDDVYGARASAPRLALHAHRVVFAHPISGDRVAIESALPRDLEALLDATPRSADE
ncbi:MAG: RluA family pseudouridine synthase [bacterium]